MFKKVTNERGDFSIDFIGAGASRSGTTWLARSLSEHPQICVPEKKELGFFHDDTNYQKGIIWYKSFFNKCKNDAIRGEFTPGYFTHAKSSARIAEYFPDIKIIFLLRNPVERAYSEYYYNRARGIDTDRDFKDAFWNGPMSRRYQRRGKYYTNISPFLEQFPRENILILIYEDILDDPRVFLRYVFSFLNVDPSFTPNTATKTINASPKKANVLRSPLYDSILRYMRRAPFLKAFRLPARAIGIGSVLRTLNRRAQQRKDTGEKIEKPALDPILFKEIAEFYRDEVTQIERLINRKLTFWTTPPNDR